jgi:DNA-binding MarR family transcriptional regulator
VSYITDGAMKRITEAFGQRLQGSGITRIQWIALYYMKTHQSISQRELSNLMAISDSSAGRLIDRLQRDGLVNRIPSQTDRRVTLIQLTEEGEHLITSLLHVGVEFNEDLMAGITDEEKIVFQRVLKKMTDNTMERNAK